MSNTQQWWSPGDPLARGARIKVEIPPTHPWMDWLKRYAHESMDNGGLMRHGILTVSLGGIKQRYDVLNVDMDRDGNFTAEWRMYGEPEDTNYD